LPNDGPRPTSSVRSAGETLVLLAAVVAFTSLILQFSLSQGRLSLDITYDDVAYFTDGVLRLEAFYGQSTVEQAFKNIKNPYHLAVTPEFHWTDQKIRVHYFSCILGYLLASLTWREARMKADFTGTLDTFLHTLNNIRLATLLEMSGKRSKPRATRQIEEMTDDQKRLMDSLSLAEVHKKPLKITGVSVYN